MKVLIATDGSDCSSAILDSIPTMKCPPGTDFHVVKVIDFFEPLPALSGVKEHEIAQAREQVEATVQRLAAALPNCKITGEVLDGYADQMIVQCATTIGADLIMVGSHGRKGPSRILVGSTSRSVLNSAHCGVRIVRHHEQNASHQSYNVLVATDDSVHSDYALDHILSAPWPPNTVFKCLTVMHEEHKHISLSEDYAKQVDVHNEQQRRNISSWLECAVARIQKTFESDPVSFEIIDGDASEQILNYADNWPADLIVMGSHGRSLVGRLLLGSVSENVATHAKCSVEVTRMPAAPKEKLHVIV